MKKYFILIIVLSNYCFGQITNGDFENWRTLPTTPLSEDPVGWTSNNLGVIHHYGTNSVEKSTDYYAGNFALRINQFYDSTSQCLNNFLVYKEFVIDTSSYPNNCPAYGINLSTDYDTLSYYPIKLSFYYKTVDLKSSPFNWFEINVIDTTDPFGLPSGSGLQTVQLTPSPTYVRKEIVLNSIIGTNFQLVRLYINIRNSYDSLYKNGYVLIDNIQFEGITSINEIKGSNSISVYPNPATNHISIISSKNEINQISILDVFGKQIKTFSSNSEKENIDISFLPKGVYIFRVHSNGKIITKRIIRQ